MSAFTNELLKKANLELAKLKDVLADHGINHCFCGEYEKSSELDEDGEPERSEFDRGWVKYFHPKCYKANGGIKPKD